MVDTEYALAGATGQGAPTDDERGRKELSALEGHDADIHTEDQGLSEGKGEFGRLGQHGNSDSRTEARSANSAPTAVTSANANTHSSSLAHDHSGSAGHELLPSTFAQWKPANRANNVPSKASSASPPDSGRSTTRSHTPDVLQSIDSEKESSVVPKQAIPSMKNANAAPITAQTSPESSESEKEADLEAGRRRSSSSDTEAETSGQTVSNSNIVNWDGPDDPQNPMNWSAKLKWGNVAVISVITFLT